MEVVDSNIILKYSHYDVFDETKPYCMKSNKYRIEHTANTFAHTQSHLTSHQLSNEKKNHLKTRKQSESMISVRFLVSSTLSIERIKSSCCVLFFLSSDGILFNFSINLLHHSFYLRLRS